MPVQLRSTCACCVAGFFYYPNPAHEKRSQLFQHLLWLEIHPLSTLTHKQMTFYIFYKRCSPDDAGEYKVVAKSLLGEAVTFGTLVVNCEWFLVSSQVSFAQKPVAKMEYSTIAPKTLKSLVSVRLAMRH